MRGTDWLRRKAAGAVRISDVQPAEITLTLDSSGPTPMAVLTIDDPVTAADVEQICELIQIIARPTTTNSEPMRCTCGVIYSRCYYGH